MTTGKAKFADMSVFIITGMQPLHPGLAEPISAGALGANLRIAHTPSTIDADIYFEHKLQTAYDPTTGSIWSGLPGMLPPHHYHMGVVQKSWHTATAEDDENLKTVLGELDGVVDEAREEGFEAPSEQAIKNARRLIAHVNLVNRGGAIEVYPTRDKDIAIYASGSHERSVEVLCESDGGALCLVNLAGRHRRAIYDSADMLPDGFLREGLAEIDER